MLLSADRNVRRGMKTRSGFSYTKVLWCERIADLVLCNVCKWNIRLKFASRVVKFDERDAYWRRAHRKGSFSCTSNRFLTFSTRLTLISSRFVNEYNKWEIGLGWKCAWIVNTSVWKSKLLRKGKVYLRIGLVVHRKENMTHRYSRRLNGNPINLSTVRIFNIES